MKLTIAATATLAALSIGAAGAQDPFVLPETEVHALPAAANAIEYELYVKVPEECRAREDGCPVVYLLDAEYSFALAANITEHLADRNRIPHLIVVSIAYRDKTEEGYRSNRSRDYTPVFDPDDGYGERYQAESGGAPAFLDAIETEIVPYVEANFPAAQRPRTLVGHSYGGLFAIYALLTEPDLFDQAISVSPSLWYHDGWIFDYEAEHGPGEAGQRNRVYLAVGAYEEQPENGRAMVSDLRRFGQRLEAWPDTRIEYEVEELDGETHASVFPRALSTGLRKLFQ
ncbi:alpha/beta hydrolase [Marinicauda algicola]|uniref:Alpha/beta hydrolase n=1 Tax=Marinicauda algicola TaxID=2029849 RepID=A0A4S2H3G4_9PROT|nr:alpha/beta hydrolase-fold protein [Marinicauda algicola]TGY89792.1 alpha/beta hydrolase [Marinicauda algicola]